MRATPRQLESLIPLLQELRRRAIEFERMFERELARVSSEDLPSARNLLHYLALRQHDLRPLQTSLTSLGLSSLGRMEPHALATIDAVLWAVESLGGVGVAPKGDLEAPCDFQSGPARLTANARRLLGPEPFRRPVRIMVTMPSEAATDPRLVVDLLASGMDVIRINCAHDDPDAWLAMIRNLRDAERTVGRSCRIYADLPGPKLRTGRLPEGARVIKLKVRSDPRGALLEPQQVWLSPTERPVAKPAEIGWSVPLDEALLEKARAGDRLTFRDARAASRGTWASLRGEVPRASPRTSDRCTSSPAQPWRSSAARRRSRKASSVHCPRSRRRSG